VQTQEFIENLTAHIQRLRQELIILKTNKKKGQGETQMKRKEMGTDTSSMRHKAKGPEMRKEEPQILGHAAQATHLGIDVHLSRA
jgi:hypothetical protein